MLNMLFIYSNKLRITRFKYEISVFRFTLSSNCNL